MHTATAGQLTELNTLNQQGIVVIGELSNLLDLEYEALSERHVEQIQAIVQDKTKVLSKLEANSKSRNELFSTLQITADKEGLDTFVSTLDNRSRIEFESHWQPLENLLLEVNEKNQRNESVITRNARNLDRLMSIIRGQNQKNVLYNNAGSKGDYTAQSRLGKA